jgi:phage gpG-like protein
MSAPSEIFKTIKLDFSGVPRSELGELKDEIKELVIDEVLTRVNKGESPVNGYGKFKSLSKKYAESEKGGNTQPNLTLDGDMLDSLEADFEGDTLTVGIFDSEQAAKAYGHNTGMEGHPWLDGKTPVRKFIPDKDEKFKKEIMDRVQFLIDARKVEDDDGSVLDRVDLMRRAATGAALSGQITVSDVVATRFIDDLLDDVFGF